MTELLELEKATKRGMVLILEAIKLEEYKNPVEGNDFDLGYNYAANIVNKRIQTAIDGLKGE